MIYYNYEVSGTAASGQTWHIQGVVSGAISLEPSPKRNARRSRP